MSIYQKFVAIGSRFISTSTLFKYGFNLSPMYRRSTAKVTAVSTDLMEVNIKLPLTWKNRNYVNSIFGGSMFSAVDPIPMVQLINIIGDDYVVWDKSASIHFKRPARETLYATFTYSAAEVAMIKERVANEQEIEIVKTTHLTGKDQSVIYCEVQKTIYIASKEYYKSKRAARKAQKLAEKE